MIPTTGQSLFSNFDIFCDDRFKASKNSDQICFRIILCHDSLQFEAFFYFSFKTTQFSFRTESSFFLKLMDICRLLHSG